MSQDTTAADDPATYRSKLVEISTTVGIVWTLLIFFVRLFIRFRIVGPFGLDDVVAALGTVLAAGQSAATFVAVDNGLGKPDNLVDSDLVDEVTKSLDAAALLYLLVMCASKCSVALLIARLTSLKYHLVATHTVIAMVVIWTVGSLCSIGVLQAKAAGDPRGFRHSLMICWLVIELIGIVLEIAIVALSVYLVWGLQMSLRLKLFVVFAFACRILITLPTLLRISYLWQSHPSTGLFFYGVDFTVATQAAMHLSIMCATFPCMKQFLQAFDTELGGTINISIPGTEPQSKNGDVYGLSQIGEPTLRPDGTTSATVVQSRNGMPDQRSIESDHSNAAIIRKRQSWEIQYENRQ